MLLELILFESDDPPLLIESVDLVREELSSLLAILVAMLRVGQGYGVVGFYNSLLSHGKETIVGVSLFL